jgi:hypothetical protein
MIGPRYEGDALRQTHLSGGCLTICTIKIITYEKIYFYFDMQNYFVLGNSLLENGKIDVE